MIKSLAQLTGTVLLFLVLACFNRSIEAQSTGSTALLEADNAALSQGHFQEAAAFFQKAVDLDSSSAPAHQQLGIALTRQIIAGNVRPSADFDVGERAQSHLKKATELTPWAPTPLLALSELYAFLAERSTDPNERAGQYRQAQDLLKQVIALQPNKAEIYLRLASLQRDEFGPILQQARIRSGAKAGPVTDSTVRRNLQEQYGSLIEEAISNARKATEMSAPSQRSLLLTARLLREKALLCDTAESYASEMHLAKDYFGQFLATGGHVDSNEASVFQK